jgi:IS5 family transposase
MKGTKLAHDIARIVNKEMVPEQTGKGRKGYGMVARMRVLVYQQVSKIHSDKGLVRHLENREDVRRALRLRSVPDRTQIGRWRRNYWEVLKSVFEKVGDMMEPLMSTDMLITDSTPLEDDDPEAEWGFYSRGCFKGFKVHVSVNQLGVPKRAEVTTGNRHDSPLFPDLIRGCRCQLVLGDAGYDCEENRRIAEKQGMKPVIARNPRRSDKKYKTPELLKKKRYIVEQFNSLLKELLSGCWQRWKGLSSKQGVIYAALIGIQVVVISSLIEGLDHLKCISKYWY